MIKRLTVAEREKALKLAKGGVRHSEIASLFKVSRQAIDKLVRRNLYPGLWARRNKEPLPNPENDLSTVDPDDIDGKEGDKAGSPARVIDDRAARLRLLNRALRSLENKIRAGRADSSDLRLLRELLGLEKDIGGETGQPGTLPICKTCPRNANKVTIEYIDVGDREGSYTEPEEPHKEPLDEPDSVSGGINSILPAKEPVKQVISDSEVEKLMKSEPEGDPLVAAIEGRRRRTFTGADGDKIL